MDAIPIVQTEKDCKDMQPKVTRFNVKGEWFAYAKDELVVVEVSNQIVRSKSKPRGVPNKPRTLPHSMQNLIDKGRASVVKKTNGKGAEFIVGIQYSKGKRKGQIRHLNTPIFVGINKERANDEND